MKLLNCIANSNGDLHRTVLALRLINERLEHELSLLKAQTNLRLHPEDLATYFDQLETRPEISQADQVEKNKALLSQQGPILTTR